MERDGIEVTVKASSRLHFGIVDMRGDLGRMHCSAGVYINQPRLVIKATRADSTHAQGIHVERLAEYTDRVLELAGIEGGVHYTVTEEIQEHKGFGSGTQLALSVGAIISRLYNVELDPLLVARTLGRSKVSGVGTQAFIHGGFIIDGGRPVANRDMVPPLIFRHPVPSDWRFVIGVPDLNLNVSGEKEAKAFKELEPPPASLVAEVARVVLLQMMPSIIEGDVQTFGESMTSMDAKFGDYWFKVQGGRYGHPRIEAGITHLLEEGAYGAGQSSWGPALYGLAESQSHAEELRDSLREFLNRGSESGDAFISRPNNMGAEITVKG